MRSSDHSLFLQVFQETITASLLFRPIFTTDNKSLNLPILSTDSAMVLTGLFPTTIYVSHH